MSVVPNSTEPEPALPPAETATADPPWGHASVYAVGAALVAAFLAWGIGERTYDYFQPAARASTRDFTVLNREKRIADQKNAAIVFGTFGALLGMLSGAAGGAARRSFPGGASAALTGLLLGGIGPALVSYELVPIFDRFYSDETPSLLLSFLVRGGIWAVAGMTAGLALGWGGQGAPGVPRALIGGLAGSVCGTVAFEVVNAVLFPGDRNDAVIPSSMPARLLASLFVAIGVALGAVFFERSRSQPKGRLAQTLSR